MGVFAVRHGKGLCMTEGVKDQEKIAEPEKPRSDKEFNFRKLEEAREKDRERAAKAEAERDMFRRELEQIRDMMKPAEQDPLESLEDVPPELKSAVSKKLNMERTQILREAEQIIKSEIQKARVEDYEKSVPNRLKSEFPDFEQVMNEDTIIELQRNFPAMTEAFCKVPDEYARKKAAYEFIKSHKKVVAPPSEEIKSKVEANMQNPYMIAPGSGTPSAVDFDIKSKAAREAAYQALKAAQRRPIGR